MKLNLKKILIREIARQNVLPRTSLTAFWNSVLLPMIARVSRTSTKRKKGKIKDRGSTRSDTGQYVFGFVNRSYFFKANFLPKVRE